jgi:hypothetical protein
MRTYIADPFLSEWQYVLPTGYKYSFQTNKKSVAGERNELPDKTALAELKELGDLIVTSTHKESPVTGALLESNQKATATWKLKTFPTPFLLRQSRIPNDPRRAAVLEWTRL